MTSLNCFAWYMTHCSWAEITAGKLFGLRRDIIIGISGECHKVIDAKIKHEQRKHKCQCDQPFAFLHSTHHLSMKYFYFLAFQPFSLCYFNLTKTAVNKTVNSTSKCGFFGMYSAISAHCRHTAEPLCQSFFLILP